MSGEPSPPKKHPPFEVASDPRFQRRMWRVQRIGWVIMVVVVVAALAGAFGGGPLSRAEATDDSGITLRYERLLRQGSPWSMEVRLLPAGDDATLWIGDALLASSRVRRIVPEPIESQGGAGGTMFRFRTAGPDQALTIRFHFETNAIGRVRARLGRPGRAPITFTQFIYP